MVASLRGNNCILYWFYRIYLLYFEITITKAFLVNTGIDLWFSGPLKEVGKDFALQDFRCYYVFILYAKLQ